MTTGVKVVDSGAGTSEDTQYLWAEETLFYVVFNIQLLSKAAPWRHAYL